jgi:tRNA pseudouridine55 synthase
VLSPDLNGVLIVDKPEGPTSHDVVARVRRATGMGRVGHTGTLDPFASGVLPLVLGRATRLAQFLIGADKEYDAQIRLGRDTDTYDVTGRPVDRHAKRSPAELGPSQIEQVLRDLRGPSLQQPPPYSAKKVGGTRAYVLARRGAAIHPPLASVFVHELKLLELQADLLRLRIVCSSGFYVRSLAHEIGTRLEVGACLQALRRVRSGEFSLERAAALEQIERDPALVGALLIPMSELPPGLPSAVLTRDGVRLAARGNVVGPAEMLRSAPVNAPRVRLLDEQGQLVAVATAVDPQGLLHPDVVVG